MSWTAEVHKISLDLLQDVVEHVIWVGCMWDWNHSHLDRLLQDGWIRMDVHTERAKANLYLKPPSLHWAEPFCADCVFHVLIIKKDNPFMSHCLITVDRFAWPHDHWRSAVRGNREGPPRENGPIKANQAFRRAATSKDETMKNYSGRPF